jgi:peptide/nickel transport system ATP-binding protein
MQVATAERLFGGPHHPYTEALLSAIPDIDGRQPARIRLTGEIPSAVNPPSGCVFHSRCPRRLGAICDEQEPMLLDAGGGNLIRCHIPAANLPRADA